MNFGAESYRDLLYWNKLDKSLLTEPPLTMAYSDDEMKEFASHGDFRKLPDIPCHNQAIERNVQITTQSAAAVIGKDKRHQNILSTNASRHKFTKDSNKDDFYSTL